MKIRLICSVCSLVLYVAYGNYTYASSHFNNLVYNIKPNPTTKSKPATLKLAAVSFLSQGHKFDKIKFKCDDGYVFEGGLCVPRYCDRTIYPLDYDPDENAGEIISCQSANNFYYGYMACYRGYHKDENLCLENDCSLFPYTTKPETKKGAINNTICQTPTEDRYQYTSCNTGWTLVNGACEVTVYDSSKYPYSSKPDSEAGVIISTKSGDNYYYGYSSCFEGWDKVNGSCNIHTCDTATYPNNACIANATCTTCKTGTTTKYSIPTCNTDYELKDGACVVSCKYTATSKPTGCSVADSCTKNSKIYYSSTCTKCNSGYTLSSGSCVPACAGYYECGGTWQYCTGTTCSADSSKCSVYCESDYFPYECPNSSECNGVYRSGYCSVNSCTIDTCSKIDMDEEDTLRSTPYTDSECEAIGDCFVQAKSCQRGTETFYYCMSICIVGGWEEE